MEARTSLDERIEELQAENAGLVDKAVGAIKKVVATIKKLKDMLLGVLSTAAGVIGKIIKNPIGFLKNLVAGVKGGIVRFKDNILTHLKKGLLSWLFGALGEAGIQLPDTFDLKGIIKLVTSILGLTWNFVRSRLVKKVGEKIVEIKGVVREPGDRTKIAVSSRDKAVDPVGACVGIKGSRVQAVVRELRGEKIDIIAWTNDPRVFIAEALNPASIEKVGIDEEKKSALVVVADSQLSLAIGKNGQNVRLAARLTGWKIDIISATEYEKEKAERDKEIKAALAEEAEAQRQQEEARQQEKARQEAEG